MSISLIIPSYNQQAYLPDAIESALDQNKYLEEIIVVDDGSTDASLKIAHKYPVKVISQVNKGLASARNTGIMNAKGDYCMFLDADDILGVNCLEKIQEAIETSKADVIAPSFKEFGIGNSQVILKPDVSLDDFKDGRNYLPYFCAIKRSKLLDIGGYSPRMVHGYEDLHMHINLLARGARIKTIPDVLVYYRTKEHSMIHDAQAHHEELMNQIKKDFPNIYE